MSKKEKRSLRKQAQMQKRIRFAEKIIQSPPKKKPSHGSTLTFGSFTVNVDSTVSSVDSGNHSQDDLSRCEHTSHGQRDPVHQKHDRRSGQPRIPQTHDRVHHEDPDFQAPFMRREGNNVSNFKSSQQAVKCTRCFKPGT